MVKQWDKYSKTVFLTGDKGNATYVDQQDAFPMVLSDACKPYNSNPCASKGNQERLSDIIVTSNKNRT
jgi:hypothetical protein